MAIFNIFDYYEEETSDMFSKEGRSKIDPDAFTANKVDENFIPSSNSKKEQLFSALAARFFFFVLLCADVAWGVYSFCILSSKLLMFLLTFCQSSFLKKSCAKSYLSAKRSIVCGIALVIAIFSPALGIMFGCMYFLMYDKNGVNEVVPSSLRDQFKEIFPI